MKVVENGACAGTAAGTLIVNTGFALLMLGGLQYLYLRQPVAYIFFSVEDGWAESATFVAWALTCAVLVWSFCKRSALRKPEIVLFALFAFFVAMEEISWGQRILGFESPEFFRIANVKGETNLHNLIKRWRPNLNASLIVIFAFVPLPLARVFPRVGRWFKKWGVPVVPFRVWPYFLLVGYLFFGRPMPRWDEIAEFCLGIAAACLAVHTVLSSPGEVSSPRRPSIWCIPRMLLVIGLLTPLMVLASWASYESRVSAGLAAFARGWFPAAGMYKQADEVFRYMETHPEHIYPTIHYGHGLVLVELGKAHEAEERFLLAYAETRESIRQRPQDPAIRRSAAKALIALERTDEAHQELMRALEVDSQDLEEANHPADESRIRFSLAQTLLLMGQKEASKAELMRALELTQDKRTRGRMRAKLARQLHRWKRYGTNPGGE